jgi:hypothetical protein
VVGLGPVGLAAGLLGGKLGAVPRWAWTPAPSAGSRPSGSRGRGSETGRDTAIALARARGRVVLVGEGNGLRVPEVSPTLTHASITMLGSWVTSLEHLRELVSRSPV